MPSATAWRLRSTEGNFRRPAIDVGMVGEEADAVGGGDRGGAEDLGIDVLVAGRGVVGEPVCSPDSRRVRHG